MGHDIKLRVQEDVATRDARDWRDRSDVAGGQLSLDLLREREEEVHCDALVDAFLAQLDKEIMLRTHHLGLFSGVVEVFGFALVMDRAGADGRYE